ncbi:hypothetical protein [Shewanella colwelliana]|uniref:hypothetical protein n=1 Tax=Shewanella colwelliana TaxID=23 RepID=UPI0022AFB8C3|nr:hypothetical protein [Shewanella colwelliana]MCZ4338574.1 hypothetical protein [Shewanella colwelliana]
MPSYIELASFIASRGRLSALLILATMSVADVSACGTVIEMSSLSQTRETIPETVPVIPKVVKQERLEVTPVPVWHKGMHNLTKPIDKPWPPQPEPKPQVRGELKNDTW